MPHLLHVDSSARAGSFSRTLSARFVEAWRAERPTSTVTYRDLAAEPVPFIGQGWTELCDDVLHAQITDPARYVEAVRTSAQRDAWKVVEPLLAELLAADVVLIGAPMYNFSVPAALKAWIDQVTFPKMDLSGRRFVVAGARGGSYRPGAPRYPYDHHERYLRDFIAGHFGVDSVVFLTAELTNTLVDPTLAHLADQHAESVIAAHAAVPDAVATTAAGLP